MFSHAIPRRIVNISVGRRFSVSTTARGKNVIGFIGLGNMGKSMALNIQKNLCDKNGDQLIVYDLNNQAMDDVVAAGAKKSLTVQELAKQSNIIITMLPATKHVEGVLHGENGVFANMPKGGLIIDSSTIDPIASKDLQVAAKNNQLHMIDAPVSGGVTGAAAGTLTFMVGGSNEVLDQARTILQAMGKNIVHCGEGGAGGITKLCNNLALAIQMVGTAEAMALGVRMGLDPKTLSGVMNTSTARCWSSEVYNPVPGIIPTVPSSNNYKGGFGSALMEKDLSLAVNMSSACKARLPLGSHAHQLYGLLCEHDFGEKDFSVVYEFLMKKAPKKN